MAWWTYSLLLIAMLVWPLAIVVLALRYPKQFEWLMYKIGIGHLLDWGMREGKYKKENKND